MRTAALLAVLSSVAFGQSNRTACSFAPDVEIDYRKLPSMSDFSRSWEEEQLFTAADQAYGTRYLAFSLALIKEYWGQELAGFDASQLLTSEQVPPEMVEALADFALSTAERFPDQSSSSPPLQVQIAEAYVSRKVRLEQVPSLLEKAIEQTENQEKYARDSDAFRRYRVRTALPKPRSASGES